VEDPAAGGRQTGNDHHLGAGDRALLSVLRFQLGVQDGGRA